MIDWKNLAAKDAKITRLRASNKELLAALDSIIIRCSEGDKRTDWLPTIERIARAAVEKARKP